jgi:hypothetical protein
VERRHRTGSGGRLATSPGLPDQVSLEQIQKSGRHGLSRNDGQLDRQEPPEGQRAPPVM